jgi:hypothetical protein
VRGAHQSRSGFLSVEQADALRTPVHRGLGSPIRPSLLAELTALYADKIRQLANFLGWDLSDWLRAPAERDR